MTGGWTIVSGEKIDRAWKSSDYSFCSGREEKIGEWRVLSLPNRFPALSPSAPIVNEGGRLFMKTQAIGVCELVEFP